MSELAHLISSCKKDKKRCLQNLDQLKLAREQEPNEKFDEIMDMLEKDLQATEREQSELETQEKKYQKALAQEKTSEELLRKIEQLMETGQDKDACENLHGRALQVCEKAKGKISKIEQEFSQ